jgi:CheY-like chemotaxis protein
MASDQEKKLILVIDDEPDVVTYLRTFFENNGYATVTATDGNEALARVKEKKPDLITLDISMPGKSGIKFYREVKGDPNLGDIPVLVITGVTGFGGSSEDFKKFLSSRKQVPPPEGFFGKPLDMDKLLDEVKGLLT